MGKILHYYKLYSKTFYSMARSSFGLKILIAFFSLLIGSSIFFFTKGRDAMIEESLNFIAYTLAPLGLLTLGYFIYCFILAPVKIYEDQRHENDKQEIQIDEQVRLLEKYQMEKDFARAELIRLQEINGKEWAGIEIINEEIKEFLGLLTIEKVNEIPELRNPIELMLHDSATSDIRVSSSGGRNTVDVVRKYQNKIQIVGSHYGTCHAIKIGTYHIETRLDGRFLGAGIDWINSKSNQWELTFKDGGLEFKKID